MPTPSTGTAICEIPGTQYLIPVDMYCVPGIFSGAFDFDDSVRMDYGSDVRKTPLALVGILQLLAASAFAEHSCMGNAYVDDKDPKGTNVRATPDVKSKVIRVIPYDENGVIVSLSAFENGWIKINDYEPIAGDKKKVNGWVSAKLLGTGGRSVDGTGKVLYAEPKPSSRTQSLTPILTQLRALSDVAFPETISLNDIGWRLLGCHGDWVHVEQRYPSSKSPLSGWLPGDSHCPNPVTTCP